MEQNRVEQIFWIDLLPEGQDSEYQVGGEGGEMRKNLVRNTLNRHFRGGIRTQCNGHILKYIKATLIKSPNNEGHRVPIRHHLPPNLSSSMRTGLMQVRYRAAVDKKMGCFP